MVEFYLEFLKGTQYLGLLLHTLVKIARVVFLEEMRNNEGKCLPCTVWDSWKECHGRWLSEILVEALDEHLAKQ